MKNREKYKNELMNAINENGRLCAFLQKYGVYRMFKPDWESFCVAMDCHFCPTALQLWLDEEYEEPPKPEVDWNKVPVDTLVRVRDNDNENWVLQYFKGISDTIPDHRYEAWDDGRTSKTTDGIIKHWRYCELVEDADDK